VPEHRNISYPLKVHHNIKNFFHLHSFFILHFTNHPLNLFIHTSIHNISFSSTSSFFSLFSFPYQLLNLLYLYFNSLKFSVCAWVTIALRLAKLASPPHYLQHRQCKPSAQGGLLLPPLEIISWDPDGSPSYLFNFFAILQSTSRLPRVVD